LLANVPSYWFAPDAVLTKSTGLNRFAWNFRYPSPKILPFGYFGAMHSYVEYTLADHAIPGRTPREQPDGPLALPGTYTIELSGSGSRDTQTLVVAPDPRITASRADLAAQFDLARRLTEGLAASFDGYESLAAFRRVLADRLKAAARSDKPKDTESAIQALDQRVEAVQTGTADVPGLGPVNREMARLFSMVESADARPSEPLQAASAAWCASLLHALDAWRQLSGPDTIKVPDAPPAPACSR
jgi:hypothetical protein